MPNHVRNVLKFNSQVIADALINDAGKVDFERIIPMDLPHKDAAAWLLSVGKPSVCLKEIAKALAEEKDYFNLSEEDKQNLVLEFLNEVFEKKRHWILCIPSLTDEKKKKELPLIFENCLATGHFDWYSWSWSNWGTKWNAYDEYIDLKDNTISFNTAWAAPHQVIAKLISMFPEESFTFEWADEDLGVNCGYLTVSKGKITNIRRASLTDDSFVRSQWLFFAKELTGASIDPKEELDEFDYTNGEEDYRVIIQEMGMDPMKIMAPVIKNVTSTEPVKEKETC